MRGLGPITSLYRQARAALVARFASPEQQFTESIRYIRGDLAALGFPIDHLSDEQLIEACRDAARRLAGLGVTAEDAARGLEAAARAYAAAWSQATPTSTDASA